MENALADYRVLIVEDEYFLADDIARALQAQGAEIVGPFAYEDEAEALIARGDSMDLAILDINLHGRISFRIADLLTERGVPFFFATGYEKAVIPERHEQVPRWEKPFDADALARTIAAQRGQPGPGQLLG